jgi:UDP-GlcNAc3NAcA epimerase
MKIVTILGARPQFIKAGSVSREISKYPDMTEIIVHTGQHYDTNMSDIFFTQMQIPKPDYFLGVGGKSHGAMTGQMVEKIEEVLLKESPDWVLLYGDTDSTLAGAIATSKLDIKIAHVEAGLRSYNMKMPEEINRILTDRISTILFCPTSVAMENLTKEGYANINCKVFDIGDVMYDGALFYSHMSIKPKDIKNNVDSFVLCTIHRAENTDDPNKLNNIFMALGEIAKRVHIILPLHPRTKKLIKQYNINLLDKITIIDPVGYLEMVWLISNSELIMTDSGGLQKEAFFFEKPCITLRDETEWSELVENRFNILVGTERNRIVSAYNEFTFNTDFSQKFYGDGDASKKVCDYLIQFK